MSMIPLLLHEAEVKLRTSVNNKVIIQVSCAITGLYPSGFLSCVVSKISM